MVLIVDIETCGDYENAPINVDIDHLKFIGAYDYEQEKYYFYNHNQRDEIRALLRRHKEIITHNGEDFDIPILKRHGLWDDGHLSLDTLKIMKNRAKFIGVHNESFSLSNLAKVFKLENKKDDNFNYSILLKEDFTDKEIQVLKLYAARILEKHKEL